MADAGMMEQVVMNLCLNARDAMPQGGRLTLAATIVEIPAQPEDANQESRAGTFVRFSVSDTGCGMDETVSRRAFEPFFTTKEPGKGTGLGLSTVFAIVQQHQGWIDVQSVVGKGSSFRVYLPLIAATGAPVVEQRKPEIRGGSEVILLVEDDGAVRRFVAGRLRALGYAVLEAGDAAEALEIWKHHGREIELLFTDMMMPGTMTGMDLALQLKQEHPSLKIISSSGHSAHLAASPLTAGSQIVFLPKPYEPAALATTVRHCLDRI
jgi:CheY-like chemotaxis protein